MQVVKSLEYFIFIVLNANDLLFTVVAEGRGESFLPQPFSKKIMEGQLLQDGGVRLYLRGFHLFRLALDCFQAKQQGN